MQYNGVINVYKEKGYTSHDVVFILRKVLNSKAGHTGTLDPNAVGVLPVCLGRSTKLADLIMDGTKKYRAEIHFGVETDTLDLTGNILKDLRPINVSFKKFQQALEKFRGEMSQIPPMYSAIKIKGQKLYELARKGEIIERPTRNINIYSSEITSFEDHMAIIDVECSKGTYIRSLISDIGRYMGVGAAMGELARIENGNFHLNNALKLEDIKKLQNQSRLNSFIIAPENLLNYPSLKISSKAYNLLLNGNSINSTYIDDALPQKGHKYKIYSHNDNFIGLYTLTENNYLKPEIILADLQKLRDV